MLYRLSLTSIESFEEVVSNNCIFINYRPYSNFIDIMEDREDLTARNQRDILNIISLVYSINKVKKDDLVWIKYKDNYILATVLEKLSLDANNARIKLNLKTYLYDNTPRVIKELFDDVKFTLVDNDVINSITLKILNILENREQKQVCEMEFVKGNGELVELRNENNELKIYNPQELSEHPAYKIKEIISNSNSGELIIKKNESSNLAVRKILKGSNPEELKEMYLNLMKEDMDNYIKEQQNALNEFMDRQKKLLDKFFDLVK